MCEPPPILDYETRPRDPYRGARWKEVVAGLTFGAPIALISAVFGGIVGGWMLAIAVGVGMPLAFGGIYLRGNRRFAIAIMLSPFAIALLLLLLVFTLSVMDLLKG